MKVSRSSMFGAFAVLIIIGMLVVAVYSSVTTLQAATILSDATVQATPSAELPPAMPPAEPNSLAGDDSPHGSTQVTGVPAIQPSIKNALPGTPAFTEGDVRKYVSSVTDGFGRIRFNGQLPAVNKIEFLAPAALRTLNVEAADLQLDHLALLCYVEYSGDFVVQGPPGLEPIRYEHVIQVFDAQTGNLLSHVAYGRK